MVEQQAFDIGAETDDHGALSSGFHGVEHGRGNLQVPGVIGFTGFQNSARGRFGIAAAFEDSAGEGWLTFNAEVRVSGVGDHVIGAEVFHDEGTGADGREVLLVAAQGGRAHAVFKLRLLNNGRQVADEGTVGERLGHIKVDAHGAVINGFDGFDIGEVVQDGAAGIRVHAEFAAEFDIVGG